MAICTTRKQASASADHPRFPLGARKMTFVRPRAFLFVKFSTSLYNRPLAAARGMGVRQRSSRLHSQNNGDCAGVCRFTLNRAIASQGDTSDPLLRVIRSVHGVEAVEVDGTQLCITVTQGHAESGRDAVLFTLLECGLMETPRWGA
jgi:hypothetical protein